MLSSWTNLSLREYFISISSCDKTLSLQWSKLKRTSENFQKICQHLFTHHLPSCGVGNYIHFTGNNTSWLFHHSTAILSCNIFFPLLSRRHFSSIAIKKRSFTWHSSFFMFHHNISLNRTTSYGYVSELVTGRWFMMIFLLLCHHTT